MDNNHTKRDPEKIKKLLSLNVDSRQYFFSKADETWLEWLWTNGMLDELRKKASNPDEYSYRLPELEYLGRMAEKEPKLVAQVIESVPISEGTFNPEVIDRFLWIIGSLPAEQIKTLIPKVLRDNWIRLMSRFGRSGYEYQRIVEKLVATKEFDTLVELAKVILTPRTEEDLAGVERIVLTDKLFYTHDISQTGIFEALADPANDKKEEALKAVLEILSAVVRLGTEREESVFDEAEPFYLLDVDLFTLELGTGRGSHHREDIQNFVALAKTLVDQIFTNACGNETESRKLYDVYLTTLPDSMTLYRLKLFAATRCPSSFKPEIKDLLFRAFSVGDRYFEIDGGAEYHRGLIAGFPALEEKTKREYVAGVLEYYGATLEDKDREGWRKRDGLEILNYIKGHLTPEEVKRSEEIFGAFPEGEPTVPHPTVGRITSGFVVNESPINPSDFSLSEIVEHLKTDWTPSSLKEQFKNDDFLRPRGAEGLGDALKEDLKVRTAEYFANLGNFFDRSAIDPGYVYALLRQIEDNLRANQELSDEQVAALLTFFDSIRISGEADEFQRGEERSYLADWITVHKSMADILIEILRDTKNSEFFKTKRNLILGVIKYLLTIKSSPDAEDDKREAGEPFHVAINSVRGRAYEAFVQFTGNDDGKTLADDVKDVFLYVLRNDESNAVRFVMGHYLATFYFRDTSFIQGLLPEIFPKAEDEKEKLYFATWEGYLANSLYKELYEELKDYYAYAITLKSDDYPDRKYLKGLDETLAGHLALAYAHFDLAPGDQIFDSFWSTPSETRHYEFASFIGRHYLTRDRASDEWLAESKVDKQKLIAFWEWMNKSELPIEPKAFSGFGFWINPDKEIIPDEIVVDKLALTLEKSHGEIDWDYGLFQRISKFAEVNPEKTLEILKNMLLLNDALNPHHRVFYDAGNNISEPLKIIYKIDGMKKPVRDLINSLVTKRGRIFWGLKEIIK